MPPELIEGASYTKAIEERFGARAAQNSLDFRARCARYAAKSLLPGFTVSLGENGAGVQYSIGRVYRALILEVRRGGRSAVAVDADGKLPVEQRTKILVKKDLLA